MIILLLIYLASSINAYTCNLPGASIQWIPPFTAHRYIGYGLNVTCAVKNGFCSCIDLRQNRCNHAQPIPASKFGYCPVQACMKKNHQSKMPYLCALRPFNPKNTNPNNAKQQNIPTVVAVFSMIPENPTNVHQVMQIDHGNNRIPVSTASTGNFDQLKAIVEDPDLLRNYNEKDVNSLLARAVLTENSDALLAILSSRWSKKLPLENILRIFNLKKPFAEDMILENQIIRDRIIKALKNSENIEEILAKNLKPFALGHMLINLIIRASFTKDQITLQTFFMTHFIFLADLIPIRKILAILESPPEMEINAKRIHELQDSENNYSVSLKNILDVKIPENTNIKPNTLDMRKEILDNMDKVKDMLASQKKDEILPKEPSKKKKLAFLTVPQASSESEKKLDPENVSETSELKEFQIKETFAESSKSQQDEKYQESLTLEKLNPGSDNLESIDRKSDDQISKEESLHKHNYIIKNLETYLVNLPFDTIDEFLELDIVDWLNSKSANYIFDMEEFAVYTKKLLSRSISIKIKKIWIKMILNHLNQVLEMPSDTFSNIFTPILVYSLENDFDRLLTAVLSHKDWEKKLNIAARVQIMSIVDKFGNFQKSYFQLLNADLIWIRSKENAMDVTPELRSIAELASMGLVERIRKTPGLISNSERESKIAKTFYSKFHSLYSMAFVHVIKSNDLDSLILLSSSDSFMNAIQPLNYIEILSQIGGSKNIGQVERYFYSNSHTLKSLDGLLKSKSLKDPLISHLLDSLSIEEMQILLKNAISGVHIHLLKLILEILKK